MSGVHFWMSNPPVPLSAGVTKYVWRMVTAANHRALVHQIGVSFNGTGPNDDPVTVGWCSGANQGSATNLPAGGVPRRIDWDMSESIRTSMGYNLSSPPASPVLLKQWFVHPQGGSTTILPLNRPLIVPGGDFYFIRCNAPQAVDCIVTVWAEE